MPSPVAPPILRSPIGFLLIPRFTVISLSSAIEPLRIANRYLSQKYAWRLLSLDGHPVPDDNGIEIKADAAIGDLTFGTLLVCSDLRPERFVTRALARWLHQLDRAGTTLGAIDTGSFVLARAGLLDRHRVTMHWEVIDAFRERYPRIEVAPTLFEVGLQRLTCAGGTAVLDMMLNAIAIDHGPLLAQRVAEHCLHEKIRSGSSSQRIDVAARAGLHHPALRRAVRLINDTPDAALDAITLASRVGISPRHLTRLFREQLGQSPAQYQRMQRLERARMLLRHSDASIREVALAAGFRSAAHFSRAYRAAFASAPSFERRMLGPAQRLIADRTR